MALPNSPEFVASFFAIQKLGAVCVNVGPLMGPDDLERAIAITTPQVAIGLDLRAPMMARASKNSANIQHWIWSSLETYQRPLDRLGYRMKRWYGGNGFHGKATHTSLRDLIPSARRAADAGARPRRGGASAAYRRYDRRPEAGAAFRIATCCAMRRRSPRACPAAPGRIGFSRCCRCSMFIR